MRTIVAGSRTATNPGDLLLAVSSFPHTLTVVLSGTARGADKLGEEWAIKNGVPLEKYPADWDKHGKSAGYKRNVLMAENAGGLIALWDQRSRGTKHMIDIAKRRGLCVLVWPVLDVESWR